MISSASFPQQLEYSQENEISKKTSPKETSKVFYLNNLFSVTFTESFKKLKKKISHFN